MMLIYCEENGPFEVADGVGEWEWRFGRGTQVV